MVFGIVNLLSLIYLTGVVAFVLGPEEAGSTEMHPRHILGCWAKILGGLVAVGVVVTILGLFAGPR